VLRTPRRRGRAVSFEDLSHPPSSLGEVVGAGIEDDVVDRSSIAASETNPHIADDHRQRAAAVPPTIRAELRSARASPIRKNVTAWQARLDTASTVLADTVVVAVGCAIVGVLHMLYLMSAYWHRSDGPGFYDALLFFSLISPAAVALVIRMAAWSSRIDQSRVPAAAVACVMGVYAVLAFATQLQPPLRPSSIPWLTATLVVLIGLPWCFALAGTFVTSRRLQSRDGAVTAGAAVGVAVACALAITG
jgi:hypothetical protein